MILPHVIFIFFFFALGACIGSFINVIVWRMPRGESIVNPPSHCPKCNTRLAWYDNVPVFGWIALGGKCRYCKERISIRYPIIEAICGGLFVLVYVTMFIYQVGPCAPLGYVMTIQNEWSIYLVYIAMIGGLLAASLVDAENYFVPIEIPWITGAFALIMHAVTDRPGMPGALNAHPLLCAMSLGAGVGLLISLFMLQKKLLPRSFEDGAPLLEIEKKELAKQGEEAPPEFTAAQVRSEIRKEMLFLMPPLVLGGVFMLLCWKVAPVGAMWDSLMRHHWATGFLGSLWGALVGGFVVWFVRIAGSMGFGREAMGLGDVHIMLGVGAAIGAAGATIVFFVAPFFGLLFALYKLIFKSGRELPYVPYLSLATLAVLIFYCRIITYLTPGMQGLMMVIRQNLVGD